MSEDQISDMWVWIVAAWLCLAVFLYPVISDKSGKR